MSNVSSSVWIPVGSLGDAFLPDNNCLPLNTDLTGRTLNLHFENGSIIEHAFTDARKLSWQISGGTESGCNGVETYTATRLRENIYFVDFIKSSERATSVSLVLDLQRNVFLAVISELPSTEEALTPFIKRIAQGKELTGVSAVFLRGSINAALSGNEALPQPTEELIGKRVQYLYSPYERYEHIYLNSQYYTWRCIDGSEKGLADTDRCHYYKIDQDLYLFVWREKIVPTLGVIMIDFGAMKTTGKIVGYESNDFGPLRNFSVGAHARIVSTITED